MKKKVLPFYLVSSYFLCFMLGCMATIPVKSATSGLLIEKKEDMPKKVGLYCYITLTPSINIKLNEELEAGLIRLDFDVLGFQQMEQALGKQLLYFDMDISHEPTLRLKSPEIAQLREDDKKKVTEQLGLQALFLGFGERGPREGRTLKEEIPYFSLGEITRIKMELIDIKTAQIMWSVDAYDRGMSEKAAYFNTAKQILILFERDIKKVKMGD